MRLVKVVCLFALLAGVFAGVASALDFNDDAEEAPIGEVGKVYEFDMPSHGGCDYAPYKYVVESGELAPGLKLETHPFLKHAGLTSGIPTEPGVFNAWIALKDVCGNSAELLFTFEIWVRRWGIATESLPGATVGSQYSAQLAGKGIPSNVTWAVTSGSLPAGLTLAANGAITGTPTAAGDATLTVEGTAVSTDPAADGTRIDSRQFTIHVLAPLSVRASRTTTEVGVPFRASLVGSGGQSPYTWAATGLPDGLAVDSSGTITGTPSRAGTFPAHVTLTDAAGSTKAADVRIVVARHLSIGTRSVRRATVGKAYRFRLVTRDGVRPVRWTIAGGRLPVGLRFNTVAGTISGVARGRASTVVVFRARDAAGGAATKSLRVSAG
jgi:hypothetical protein